MVKAIIVVLFTGAILCGAFAESKKNKLSEYYGFGEIEIIKSDWGIKNLNIADFNRDGRNDIVWANNRRAKIEVFLQKKEVGPGEQEVSVDPDDIDINTITPPTRFKADSVSVSEKISSLVCGDLNSDGMADLAYYGEPRGLYVILQKEVEADTGKLKSLSWRTRKKIKIDDGLLVPNALECADLNNDGRDDLALAGSDAIYIILQKEDGALAEAVKYPTAALTLSVEVGDLNGDNITDLILVTSDSEKPVHVRFGLKTGQLGPEKRFFIDRAWAFEAANIDGEIGDEILSIDAASGRLICYKFAAEKEKDVDWPILFYPLASGEGNTKRDLVIGDFDGDGTTDITISDPGAAELIFYKQTTGIGLAEPVKFPALADITRLSAEDIDGDGKTELAVLSVKEKIIGISKFENERLSFPKPVKIIDEPLAMELADVDCDGNMDCVYISKDANETRTLRVIYDLDRWKKLKQPTAGVELAKLTSNPQDIKVLDVDQDGLQDVLIFVEYESPLLVRQIRKGKLEMVDSPEAQASLIKDLTPRSIAVADVDDKIGKELLAAQKNFARSLIFSNGRRWDIIDQYNAKGRENNISTVAAFDINRLKVMDRPTILLLDGQKGRLQILKAGSDKTYRVEKELNVGQWSAADHLKMLFAPFTGGWARSILLFDGDKFAVITPPDGGIVPHSLEQQFSYETKIKDGVYGNFTAGEINSDGWADIIMVEYKQNHIEILTFDAEYKPMPALRFKLFEQKSYRDKKTVKTSVEPRELKVADVT
ncbi:MAG: FG-GAP repeat domain-containing protein, partial [Planctomycetota bacterium]